MTVGLETVQQVLEEAGYHAVPMPLVVAGTSFDFDAALIGSGSSQDLVLIGGISTDAERLVQLVSGLNRSLDRVESRRPVSLVLLGERPDPASITSLEAAARVMTVNDPDPTQDEVALAVAILLPLRLPATAEVAVAPLDDLRSRLPSTITDVEDEIISTAVVGADQVAEALRRYVAGAFDVEGAVEDF
jgi:hypothetical protein